MWLKPLERITDFCGRIKDRLLAFGETLKTVLDTEAPEDGPNLKFGVVAGGCVIAAFLVFFLGWASLAPLESAAVAPGVVSVDGNRKTIQHLEGGIVKEILVKDGDRIEAGQVLVLLDDIKARASVDLLQGRYMVASAVEARLIAERDRHDEVTFPDWLLETSRNPKVAEIIQAQNNEFNARRKSVVGQAAILNQRVAQYTEEISGLKGQIASKERQLVLVRAELKDMGFLYKKGLARKSRILALERRVAEIEGAVNLHRSQIARAKQGKAESRLRVNELQTAVTNDVVKQLRAMQAERYDLLERLRAAGNVARRTSIRAPITGTVVGLNIHTTGGGVEPGAPLMDVVPEQGALVVEARVAPADIDVVRKGLTAKIRFTAFNQRNRLPVPGKVTSVSADRLTDQATGEHYYLARVEMDAQTAGKRSRASLYPGMTAEVMIVTDRRTFLAYLIEPFSRSIDRAFRES